MVPCAKSLLFIFFMYNSSEIVLEILCVCVCYSLSHAPLFVTPWTVAHHAPLSMGFSSQGYWNGLPFPSPGNLPNPSIKPGSPALQADSFPSELPFIPTSSLSPLVTIS